MVRAIVGANWGDEGKGKITDMLGEKSDIIVRFQGGSNKPVFLITALVFLDFLTGMAHPADGARDTVGNENTCLADENQRRDRTDYQIALLL